jgi:predicted GNAT superfamily acetyltransferase
MLGSVIVGHVLLWLVTRFIKQNNKPIVGYSRELEELEAQLTTQNENPKDVNETKERIEEIAREMRENKR